MDELESKGPMILCVSIDVSCLSLNSFIGEDQDLKWPHLGKEVQELG